MIGANPRTENLTVGDHGIAKKIVLHLVADLQTVPLLEDLEAATALSLMTKRTSPKRTKSPPKKTMLKKSKEREKESHPGHPPLEALPSGLMRPTKWPAFETLIAMESATSIIASNVLQVVTSHTTAPFIFKLEHAQIVLTYSTLH